MPRKLRVYIAVVAISGLGVFAGSAARWLPTILHAPATYWVFAALLVVTEGVSIPRNENEGESNVSTTFGFAMLIIFGTPAVIFSQAIACLITDRIQHKPWWKAAFNAGQLSLSFAIAGTVLDAFPGLPTGGSLLFGGSQLPGIIVAAATFFLVNVTLNGVALAMALKKPILPYIATDMVAEATATGALLLIAPLLVSVAHFNLLLTALVIVPLLGVWGQGRLAVHTMRLALFDPLTGLPNRNALTRTLNEKVAHAEDGARLCVMLLDLDRFKDINDTLGHHRGEDVIKEVAARLRSSVRESDEVARLGGDEFAVVLHDAGRSEAARLAERILAALDRPLDLEGLPLHLTASIGIATYPEHAADGDALLRYADVAMYVAKGSHVGYAVYRQDFDKHSPTQLAMVAELKRAIDSEAELQVHYQPKIDIATDEIVAVEALLRWQHPSLGLLYPDTFIPLAERTGQIKPLTSWVLAETAAQCGTWADTGRALSVAVNLSARNLLDHQLVAQMERLLDEESVDPALMTVEITESSLMVEPELAMRILEGLRGLGVRISIDDFGTGYSSLAYLKRLPVSELKIDRSFVRTMSKDENDLMIVRSVIDLGHALGLDVVAEGVADEITFNLLTELGCDLAQGFLFTRPLPVGDFERWSDVRRPARTDVGRVVDLAPPHLNSLARHRSVARQLQEQEDPEPV